MTPDNFNRLIDQVFVDLKELLTKKEAEYSQGSDRLDQFKKGAVLTGSKPHQVLAGMMIKHTTSIYDMLRADNTNSFSTSQWDAKIYDHINYLLLLLGIIEENAAIKITLPDAATTGKIVIAPKEPLPYQYPTPKGLDNDKKRT